MLFNNFKPDNDDIILSPTGNYNWHNINNKKIVITDPMHIIPPECNNSRNLYFVSKQLCANIRTLPIWTNFETSSLNISRTKLCFSQINLKNGNRKKDFDNVDLSFVDQFPISSTANFNLHLNEYKYTLSPHGFSPDCFRHWEALSVGCIPITIKHSLLEPFYDAPILFLNDWSELNEQLLIDKYDEINNKNWKMGTKEYWHSYILLEDSNGPNLTSPEYII